MTARLTPGLLIAVLGACAHVQPEFVEPNWGDAPAPYTSEVTEVTLDYRHCGAKAAECTSERIVFRRDGQAQRAFFTSARRDSILAGTVDSVSYVQLVEYLRSANHFLGSGGGGHEPLSVDSYIVSGASLCRRAIKAYVRADDRKDPIPEVPAAILTAADRVHWSRCCRASHSRSGRGQTLAAN